MHDCYVTATLLNSWRYYLKSYDEDEEQAKQDFLNYLNKVKTEPTEAMQRGIDFENKIRLCDEQDLYSRTDNTVNEITDYIKNGLWQETVSKHIDIDGLDVLVYGKADVIKMDTIYDIKRVSKYKTGQYSKSVQHLFYLYCTELPVFKYLISNGSSVFCETYTLSSYTENLVKIAIQDFFQWLKITGNYELYLEKWKGTDK